MDLSKELEEVTAEIEKIEKKESELSARQRNGIASEDDLAELDLLPSVLSDRESYRDKLVYQIHFPVATASYPSFRKYATHARKNPSKLEAFSNACMDSLSQFQPGKVFELPDGVFILGNEGIDSSIYVRPCYPDLLKLSLNIIARLQTPHLVILGSDGIGKTYFGYVLLIYLLQQGATVVYECGRAKRRYLFSRTWTTDGQQDDFADILEKESTFYIADAVEPVYVDAKTVLLTCPRRDHWSNFSDDNCAIRYMPIWSLEEILQCRALLYSRVTEEEAEELFTKWGGTVRYVLPNAHIEQQQDKLEAATSRIYNDQIINYVELMEAGDYLIHHLVHIHVQNFKNVSYMFASKTVADCANENLIAINYQPPFQPFLSSKDQSDCAVLRGLLFEEYAHRILSQGGAFSTRSLFPNCDAPETTLTLKQTHQFTFNKVDSIHNGPTDSYYRPRSPTFPSFDSFIKPNVIFRMITSRDHGCKGDGLDYVLQLIGGHETPQLYFVVPDELFEDFGFQPISIPKRSNGSPSINLKSVQQHVLKINTTSEARQIATNISQSNYSE